MDIPKALLEILFSFLFSFFSPERHSLGLRPARTHLFLSFCAWRLCFPSRPELASLGMGERLSLYLFSLRYDGGMVGGDVVPEGQTSCECAPYHYCVVMDLMGMESEWYGGISVNWVL